MADDSRYMSERLRQLNQRQPQREKDRATTASYPRGTGRLHTMGDPDDEFSRAVERSYEYDQRNPSRSRARSSGRK